MRDGIGWKTVTRSLSDYSLVTDVCWYFVTYLYSSLLDYQVRATRPEGHTRFFAFASSKVCVVFPSPDGPVLDDFLFSLFRSLNVLRGFSINIIRHIHLRTVTYI